MSSPPPERPCGRPKDTDAYVPELATAGDASITITIASTATLMPAITAVLIGIAIIIVLLLFLLVFLVLRVRAVLRFLLLRPSFVFTAAAHAQCAADFIDKFNA